MALKSPLKPESSIIVSLTVAGFVAGSYFGVVGPVSDVHATPALDGNVGASLKKAGWAAAALVGASALLSRDLNPLILGGGAIIVMELYYRHAHLANSETGQIQVTAQDYQPSSALAPVVQLNSPGLIEASIG